MPSPRSSPTPIPIRPSQDARGAVTVEEGEAMLRAVLTLFDKWKLSTAEKLVLLGNPSERTFQRWRRGVVGGLSTDTIHRLGDLLGIHKALRYMFADVERAYGWVRRPNEAFGGRPALDVMLQGAPTDLARIRAYLDAERGGW